MNKILHIIVLEKLEIYWYNVNNVKNILEGELHDFKIFLNNEIFVSLPASQLVWPQETTYHPNQWPYIASILSQSKSYFRPHEPLLFWKWFLLCAIVITFIYNG